MSRRISILIAVLAILLAAAWLAGRGGGSSPPAPPPNAQSVAPEVGTTTPPAGEPADPTPEAGAQAAGPVWEILLLGPLDRPLEGAYAWPEKGWPSEGLASGPDGVIRLPREGGKDELKVVLSGTAGYRRVTLTGPRTVLRFPDLLPLEIRVVDGETGALAPGAEVELHTTGGEPIPVPVTGGRGELEVSPFHRGRQARVTFGVTPPDGYALADRDVEDDITRAARGYLFWGAVGRFAERVSMTIVLRPEARIRLRVTNHDGTPAAGAAVTAVRLGKLELPVVADPTNEDGQTLVRGVPFLRGEKLRVEVEGDGLPVVVEPAALPRVNVEVLLTARLPEPDPERDWITDAPFDGPETNSSIGIGGSRWPEPKEPDRARLEVRVVLRDGSAGGGLTVRVSPAGRQVREAVTDGTGFVAFEGLSPGKARVYVRESGFLCGDATPVQLENGETARVEIREEEPRELEVIVTDENDEPLPFAEIEVSALTSGPYVFQVGGVQHLTIYTDERGRVVLPNLPPGHVVVTATYGSRSDTGAAKTGGRLVLSLTP